MRGSASSRSNQSSQTTTETMRLLGLKAVQTDLGLTLNEWTALSAFARTNGTATLTEDAAFTAVGKILTEAQTTRLRELLVQDLGYAALSLSSVRAQLELTTEQATSVTALTSNLQIAKKAVSNPQALVELQKTTRAALAKALTASQDAKLRSLAGRALR